MTKCNCLECRMLNLDPAYFPEHSQYGCGYCAMTGFEDYPSNKIPCRILISKGITPKDPGSSMIGIKLQPGISL